MERRKINKWNALIYFDEVENIYTITFDGDGGAIVSDESLTKAENRFIDGMTLAEAVSKFTHS